MIFFEKYGMLFGAKSIEEIKLDSHNFSILKINNFVIKQQYGSFEKFTYIEGKNFIIQYDQYIWHYIQEMVGQYELVKHIIPDIKPLFLDPNIYSHRTTYNDFKKINLNHLKYLDDIHDVYAIDDNVYQYNQNILIEELYIILDLKGYFPDELFIHHGVIPYWSVNKEHEHRHFKPSGFWQLDGLKFTRKTFTEYIKKSDQYPKKIYISRKDSAKRHKEIKDKDSFWYNVRTFENEQYIEDYFSKMGYVSFQFEGMSYLEQLSILYNATHIAGTIGSAFINTFICQENTKLIEIHVKKYYDFNYEYIANMFKINRKEINLKYLDDIKGEWTNEQKIELEEKLNEFHDFY